MGALPLHSILVIFQSHHVLALSICTELYIPFWLYSNFGKRRAGNEEHDLYIPFWLYSNEVLDRIAYEYEEALHSILVIFQSLAYEIEKLYIQTLHSILVIFQSRKFIIIFDFSFLYIPFWLYSNAKRGLVLP